MMLNEMNWNLIFLWQKLDPSAHADLYKSKGNSDIDKNKMINDCDCFQLLPLMLVVGLRMYEIRPVLAGAPTLVA